MATRKAKRCAYGKNRRTGECLKHRRRKPVTTRRKTAATRPAGNPFFRDVIAYARGALRFGCDSNERKTRRKRIKEYLDGQARNEAAQGLDALTYARRQAALKRTGEQVRRLLDDTCLPGGKRKRATEASFGVVLPLFQGPDAQPVAAAAAAAPAAARSPRPGARNRSSRPAMAAAASWDAHYPMPTHIEPFLIEPHVPDPYALLEPDPFPDRIPEQRPPQEAIPSQPRMPRHSQLSLEERGIDMQNERAVQIDKLNKLMRAANNRAKRLIKSLETLRRKHLEATTPEAKHKLQTEIDFKKTKFVEERSTATAHKEAIRQVTAASESDRPVPNFL